MIFTGSVVHRYQGCLMRSSINHLIVALVHTGIKQGVLKLIPLMVTSPTLAFPCCLSILNCNLFIRYCVKWKHLLSKVYDEVFDDCFCSLEYLLKMQNLFESKLSVQLLNFQSWVKKKWSQSSCMNIHLLLKIIVNTHHDSMWIIPYGLGLISYRHFQRRVFLISSKLHEDFYLRLMLF